MTTDYKHLLLFLSYHQVVTISLTSNKFRFFIITLQFVNKYRI